MSDDIKLSLINQKILQDRQGVNQNNNTGVNFKVPDMIEDRGAFKTNILDSNLDRILETMDGYDKLWLKSLISSDYQKTFLGRHFGFITDPKIGQMHIIYNDGRLSGYSKTVHKGLKEILENDKEIDRLTSLPNYIKEKQSLSDSEYIELVRTLKSKGNIFQTI